MKQTNDKDAIQLLRGEGFTASEINRLIQLRRDYMAGKLDQKRSRKNPLLRFGQWCVRAILTEEVCYALSHPSIAERPPEEGE